MGGWGVLDYGLNFAPGSVTKRPRYWGKLVMDLIYDYLDPDVARYLRENGPSPRKARTTTNG
jgi:hypothetical protein